MTKREDVSELFNDLELLVLNMHTVDNKEHSGPALDLIVKLRQEVHGIYEFLADFEPELREWEQTSSGYGYYPGGDPRSFSPDEESCSKEEIAAHRAACEAWDRGERPDPGGPHPPLAEGETAGDAIGAGASAVVLQDGKPIRKTVAHYGIGTYSLLTEEQKALIDRFDRILYG